MCLIRVNYLTMRLEIHGSVCVCFSHDGVVVVSVDSSAVAF